MFDFTLTNAFVLGVAFLVGMLAVFLLGLLGSFLVMWADDFEEKVKNPVEEFFKKFDVTSKKYEISASSTSYRDAVEAVTGNRYSDERYFTEEQWEKIIEINHKFAKVTDIVEFPGAVKVALFLFFAPIFTWFTINFTAIIVSITTVVVTLIVARTSRRTYKKLKKHISDPNAHKAVQDEGN